MVIRDGVTTEEYHHQKEKITARILTTKPINARSLKDVQIIQIPEINKK